MRVLKNNKLYAFLGVGIILCLVGWIAIMHPFKVVDPTDPRFDPVKFSFSDYKTKEELRSAFLKLFPLGTDSSFVDNVLIEVGGAKAGISDDPLIKSYLRMSFKQENYVFTFDGNNKLVNIYFPGEGNLYTDNLH